MMMGRRRRWSTTPATGDHDLMYEFEEIKFDDQTVTLDDLPQG